jgi:ATP-dependent DNA ligase
MRREPIETRKATLASIVRKSLPGAHLNEYIAHPKGAVVFQHAWKLGAEGIISKRLGSRYRSGRFGLVEIQEPAGPGGEA